MCKLFSSLMLFICLSFNGYVNAKENEHSSKKVYAQIKDIYNPTIQDYYLIQDYLAKGEREGLEKLNYTARRQRNCKIIGNSPDLMPESGMIAVNTDVDDRENCLVLYASFNLHYPAGLKRLIQLVKESDFKGHILYHMGGWPDLEGGSLTLAHVPFAFKPCCFKEAKKLGFKRALWLDTSVIPLVSLNTIFAMIEEKGYFSIKNCHQVGPYCNSKTAAYFGLTHKQTYKIVSCQAGFLGVDFTTDQGNKIIDLWYQAAKDTHAFYSARSDQTALSLVLHQCNLTCLPDCTVNTHSPRRRTPSTLFVVDRRFVQH